MKTWFKYADEFNVEIQKRLFEMGWVWRGLCPHATIPLGEHIKRICLYHTEKRIAYSEMSSDSDGAPQVSIIDALYPAMALNSLPKWVKDVANLNNDVKPDTATNTPTPVSISDDKLLQAADTMSMNVEIDGTIEVSEVRAIQSPKECNCPINHLGILHTIKCQPLPYSPWPIRQPAPTMSNAEINAAHMCKGDISQSGLLCPETSLSAISHVEIISQLCGFHATHVGEAGNKSSPPLLTLKQAAELLRQDFVQSCKKDLSPTIQMDPQALDILKGIRK